MPTQTASQRGLANRNRGAQAERDLCRWFRANGFPQAERAVRTGYRTADRVFADQGDITGTGLTIWSVKDCARERIADWFDELDEMSDNSEHGSVNECFIVQKRRGHADPGSWWCWQWQSQYLGLYRRWLERTGHIDQFAPMWVPEGTEYPMRMELGHVVPLLLAAGYGEPS